MEIDEWESLPIDADFSNTYNQSRKECSQGCDSRDVVMAVLVNGSRGLECHCGHQETEER